MAGTVAGHDVWEGWPSVGAVRALAGLVLKFNETAAVCLVRLRNQIALNPASARRPVDTE
jgi:hypothetical protein